MTTEEHLENNREVEETLNLLLSIIQDLNVRCLFLGSVVLSAIYGKQHRRLGDFDLLLDDQSPVINGVKPEPSTRLQALLPAEAISHWDLTADGDDQALAKELRLTANVVLADNVEFTFSLVNGRGQYIFEPPYKPFLYALGEDSGSVGNIDVQPDEDGVVRRGKLFFNAFRQLPLFSHSFALRERPSALFCRT